MTKNKKKLKVDEGEFDADSSSKALTAEEVSEKYTAAELKSILKENGLKVSGKKQDLVERALPILNDSDKAADEDESAADTVNLASQVEDDDLLKSVLPTFGINYEDLAIDEKIVVGDDNTLNIIGFTENGLSMSDSTLSIVAASDSSNIDLKMNIPEVSYTDFESTIFTFKNLDLSILPSSKPQSLEFSAAMDTLEIITEKYYVNLKGLNLLFKSFPDNSIGLDINIDRFIYPDFDGTSINFEDLDLSMTIGVDEQPLNISVDLGKLNLLNKEYRVKLSDLDLNILLSDLKLSSLDLSILMPDFHYTNFDDVIINMDNVDVSLEHTPTPNSVNVNILMDALDATGLTSLDEMFPMLSITDVNIKAPTDDSESSIKLVGLMSLLDITQMDLTTLGALLSSGFDLDTYMSNMPDYYKGSLDGDADISGTKFLGLDISGLDLAGMFKNCDYSCLNAIKLNLTGFVDSTGIDLANFGIDVSDYDLSSISMSDLIDSLISSEFVQTAITAISKLFTIDFEKIDMSGLVAGFDKEKFDLSSLLGSLNLSEVDISGIAEMLSNLDLGSVFEKCDFSCLGTIKLDLTGLIDSLGIDLAALGFDLSDYDLSSISLAEIMGIVSNIDLDMDTLIALLQLLGLDLSDIDLEGLIASFDTENFDITSLLASLNLSDLDISALMDMISNLDLAGIFENFDFTTLDAIKLDLTGLIDSIGIDLAVLGIDLSDYDLSSITISQLMGIISNFDLSMDTIAAIAKLFGLNLEDLDLSGIIASFDEENFDLSSLLASFNLSEIDIQGIMEMFSNSDIDFAGIFENCDYSSLEGIVLDLTGLLDSAGIDLADFGIDVSDYDLSAISLPEVIGIISSLDLDLTKFDLSAIDFESLDMSGLVASFDEENFDLSSLLASLNLSKEDISGIIDMFSNIDLGSVFEKCDLSCLGAIKLDLTGLIDSIGIDLAALGIDLSDYDLSAISLAELIGIISSFDLDMNTIAAIAKLFGLELDDLDLSGLIASFDTENFDISSLLASLNISGLDISGMMEMFNNMDVDFAAVFENFDDSCLDAIVLDLTGLLDSAGIDLADFGMDASGYDLSSITLSEIVDIICDSEFIKTSIAAMMKLFEIDWEELDFSSMIAGFDAENFDISGLLDSLNLTSLFETLDLSGLNNTGIFDRFDMNGFDLAEFMNGMIISFMQSTVPEDASA